MNYYIQGDAAKAAKIRAAWEKLGIKASGYDFSRKDVLFFTFEAKGKTYMMSSLLGSGLDNIILTHPDYEELPLPKPHYDIKNFKPFDKVLVRQNDSCTWGVSFFGRYSEMFICCSNVCFEQCIPFNEKTEHLLGTTDMPSEEYINW